MILGALFVYSATMVSASASLAPWYNQSWFRQIIWYVLGTGAAAALCCVDYHTIARWSMIAYWFAVLLLAVVLFFGTVRFGARRWFDLGFFSLQPSEFSKLAFILAQAHFLSRPVEELRVPLIFWKALGLMMLPFILILKEPDLGSALVLLPTGLAMLFVAGTPRRFLVWMFVCVGILGALFVADVLFMPV
jgi:rod shape determining protein RodA